MRSRDGFKGIDGELTWSREGEGEMQTEGEQQEPRCALEQGGLCGSVLSRDSSRYLCGSQCKSSATQYSGNLRDDSAKKDSCCSQD